MTIVYLFVFFCLLLFVPTVTRMNHQVARFLMPVFPLFFFIHFLIQFLSASDKVPINQSLAWVPSLNLSLSFHLDGLALIFSMIISGIGLAVIIYSGSYLKHHHQLGRFYLYILFFMGSMLGVVLSDNIYALFVFWELTSISSFFLIGFDHEKEESRWSALQALLITGIGGVAMLAGFILLSHLTGTSSIQHMITNKLLQADHASLTMITLLIAAGAFTKSAQVPFHFWLPGAMVAPAPVSTFLHSATMVKAGVYLLARLTPVLGHTPLWHYLLMIVGGITMLIGAFLAWPQTDLKRLLAYSTVSALGALVLLIGIGSEIAIKAAILYLIIHALYKGSLFMIAGIIDHESGTRDIRQLRGLHKLLPMTAIAAGLAALSMAGIPPMIGFYGKEFIYETALHAHHGVIILTFVFLIANAVNVAIAGLTGFVPFWGSYKKTPYNIHDEPASMWSGPMVLALLGLLLGLFPKQFAHLAEPAIQAILNDHTELHIHLWHGFTPILGLSLATFALGAILIVLTKHRATIRLAAILSPFYPSVLFKKSLDGLISLASKIIRILQNGELSRYVFVIFISTFGLIGMRLLYSNFAIPIQFIDLQIHELLLGLLMLAGAVGALLTNHRLAAVVFLGVVGYGVAFVYIFYGAPDLAITQILVETLTIILFSLVVYRLPKMTRFSRLKIRIRDAILSLFGGALMSLLVLKALNVQIHPSISDYFIKNSEPLAHGRNIVNVILVDFRAIDTLGETTVLAIAAIGVFALSLHLKKKGQDA